MHFVERFCRFFGRVEEDVLSREDAEIEFLLPLVIVAESLYPLSVQVSIGTTYVPTTCVPGMSTHGLTESSFWLSTANDCVFW